MGVGESHFKPGGRPTGTYAKPVQLTVVNSAGEQPSTVISPRRVGDSDEHETAACGWATGTQLEANAEDADSLKLKVKRGDQLETDAEEAATAQGVNHTRFQVGHGAHQ